MSFSTNIVCKLCYAYKIPCLVYGKLCLLRGKPCIAYGKPMFCVRKTMLWVRKTMHVLYGKNYIFRMENNVLCTEKLCFFVWKTMFVYIRKKTMFFVWKTMFCVRKTMFCVREIWFAHEKSHVKTWCTLLKLTQILWSSRAHQRAHLVVSKRKSIQKPVSGKMSLARKSCLSSRGFYVLKVENCFIPGRRQKYLPQPKTWKADSLQAMITSYPKKQSDSAKRRKKSPLL